VRRFDIEFVHFRMSSRPISSHDFRSAARNSSLVLGAFSYVFFFSSDQIFSMGFRSEEDAGHSDLGRKFGNFSRKKAWEAADEWHGALSCMKTNGLCLQYA